MLQHFLTFDKLIGTKLIKVLYYLGLLGIVLSGIAGLFGGIMTLGSSFIGGLTAIGMAILVTIIGIAFWRFLCEIYMLFFRMSDDLRDIKNHQLGNAPNAKDVDIDL